MSFFINIYWKIKRKSETWSRWQHRKSWARCKCHFLIEDVFMYKRCSPKREVLGELLDTHIYNIVMFVVIVIRFTGLWKLNTQLTTWKQLVLANLIMEWAWERKQMKEFIWGSWCLQSHGMLTKLIWQCERCIVILNLWVWLRNSHELGARRHTFINFAIWNILPTWTSYVVIA